MKKRLLTAAMVSVALASCVTDESLTDVGKQDAEIKFVAANYVAQTRGGHGEGAFSNDDFSVYAWEDKSTNTIMDAVQIEKQGNDFATSNGNSYYWPNDVTLDFTAVSPANNVYSDVERLYTAATAGVPEVESTTITFTFNEDNPNPTDVNLMYADYVSQTYDYDNPNSVAYVALLFRHVLAKLKVVLTQDDPDTHENGVKSYEVKVKNLTISGIRNEGSLTVDNDYVTAAQGDANITLWTNPAGNATWTIYNNDAGFSLQTNSVDVQTGTLTKTPTNFDSTNNGWENYYVMPQTMVEPNAQADPVVVGQVLSVTYDVITKFVGGTTATKTFTKTVDLKDIDAITNWYANKFITYTINIQPANLTAITFTATEENWCTGHTGTSGSTDVK